MEPKKNNTSRKRGASKKTTTTALVPALKPTGKPKSRGDKWNYKLGDEHIQLIIDMTIAGYTNGEILDELKKEHKISITEQTLCYHKRQNAEKLMTSVDDQLKAAYARSPLMQLPTRVAVIGRALDKEMKKKNPSGYAIAMLMGQAETAIKNFEVLKLKREELARKTGKTGEVDHDEYIRDMENRSRTIKDVEDVEARIIGSGAEDELLVKPPVQRESLVNRPEAAAEIVTDDLLEGEDDGTGLSEADLRI